MTTEVHKITLLVVDHDNVGADGIAMLLENTRYANRCMHPDVIEVATTEIEWDDNHPLNTTDKAVQIPAFRELFPNPVVEIGYEPGDTAPVVNVIPENSVTVKLMDEGAAARHVLTHGGVSLYYCDDDCTLSEHWLSTIPYLPAEAEEAFDWRELDCIAPQEQARYEELFPEDEIRQILAYNIDLGIITEDGLDRS